MRKPLQPRVAIGIIVDASRAERVVHRLRVQGLMCDRICLGLPAGKEGCDADATADARPARLARLGQLIIVSEAGHPAGFAARLAALDDRCAERSSLHEVLAGWLPERHAAQLDHAVRAGRTLAWVPLKEPADELAACTVLLHEGCDTVQVHDLPPLQDGTRTGPPQRIVAATGWSVRC